MLPGLRLYLADRDQDDLAGFLREPRFWTFCWPAGRVLAEYLLDNPHRVRDRTVCDLGAGSGIVAIAAMKAGARRAIALDEDPAARAAIARNARLNGVEIGLTPEPHDLLLAADLLYEEANQSLLTHPCLVADCRAQPRGNFTLLGWRDSAPLPDLGFDQDFRRVGLWQSAGPPQSQ